MSNDNLKRIVPAVAVINSNTSGGKGDRGNANGEDERAGKESGSTANALIELAVGSCQFFLDERGDEYSILTDSDIQRTLILLRLIFPNPPSRED